jgi:hypothetical protein
MNLTGKTEYRQTRWRRRLVLMVEYTYTMSVDRDEVTQGTGWRDATISDLQWLWKEGHLS